MTADTDTRLDSLESGSAQLSAKIDDLTELINGLSLKISGSPAHPQPQPQPPPPPPPPAIIPPLSTGSAAGASSPSTFHIPPWVASAVIVAIINHEFRAADLYKLDPKFRDSRKTKRLIGLSADLDGQLELQDASGEYKSMAALLVPLQTYFNILLRYISNSTIAVITAVRIATAFNAYTMQLMVWSSEYEFAAVLDYHTQFFDSRVQEMLLDRDYFPWGQIDTQLQARCLIGHLKARVASTSAAASSMKKPKPPQGRDFSANATQTCDKFNNGRCSGAICPTGRRHICTFCKHEGRGDLNHPASTHGPTHGVA